MVIDDLWLIMVVAFGLKTNLAIHVICMKYIAELTNMLGQMMKLAPRA